jgi:replicative DNA helicase
MTFHNNAPAPDLGPINIDAEQSLLGACLMQNEVVSYVSGIVSPGHFGDPVNAEIYRVLSCLVESGKTANLVTLKDAFPHVEMPEGHTMRAYLAHLCVEATPAILARDYASIIRDHAHRREIIQAANALLVEAREMPVTESPAKALDRFSETTRPILDADDRSSVAWAGDIAGTILDEIDQVQAGALKFESFTTGFEPLDKVTRYRPGEVVVTAGRPGAGKAQPLRCKIKTETGWTDFGSVKVGERLASIDGAESLVTAIHPRGRLMTYCVRLSDGRETFCCADHLWEVKYRDWDTSRVLSTAKLIIMLTRKRYQNRLIVRRVSGNFGHEKTLPIDPWLVGAMIGNGSTMHATPLFSTADEDTINRLNGLLPTGITSKKCGDFCYRISGVAGNGENPFMSALRDLGMTGKRAEEKRIPNIYLCARRRSRVELLRGLMDTDGWAEKNGSVYYATSSGGLADDVCQLAWSLGFWTSRTLKPSFVHDGNGGREQKLDCHQICISGAGIDNAFHLARKKERVADRSWFRSTTIESITPHEEEECVCISVSHPSRLYVTDDYIVTHNSIFATSASRRIAQSGIGVLEFPLENGKDQAVSRHLSELAYSSSNAIFFSRILDRDLPHETDRARVAKAWQRLKELPIVIDDSERITLARLGARIKQVKGRLAAREIRLGVVMIDHLDYLDATDRYSGNRVQEIFEIMTGLKALARRDKVQIHLFCQLNRQVEGRAANDRRPQLQDLRNSGDIEQCADVVNFLYREAYYAIRTPEYIANDPVAIDHFETIKNDLDVICAKVRTGPTKMVKLFCDPAASFISGRPR